MVATATELGAVVRWVRGERRVPMEDAAARSGVSRDLLRDLERAARGVNLAQALDVFASFGIDVVLVPRDRSLTMRDPRDLPTTAPTLRRGPRPTVADSVAVFLDGRRVNVAKPGQQAHPLWGTTHLSHTLRCPTPNDTSSLRVCRSVSKCGAQPRGDRDWHVHDVPVVDARAVPARTVPICREVRGRVGGQFGCPEPCAPPTVTPELERTRRAKISGAC